MNKKPFWYTYKPTCIAIPIAFLSVVILPTSYASLSGFLVVVSALVMPAIWLVGTYYWKLQIKKKALQGDNVNQKPGITKSLLRSCKACGEGISKNAVRCPKCGQANIAPARILIVIAAIIGSTWYFFGYRGIEKHVVDDVLGRYELAVQGGDSTQMCVYAGMVVAAYNQAHDQENYLKWIEIKRNRCAR